MFAYLAINTGSFANGFSAKSNKQPAFNVYPLHRALGTCLQNILYYPFFCLLSCPQLSQSHEDEMGVSYLKHL